MLISISNFSDVLAANRGRVVASVSIHTYSQLWMSPYGYQSALPADYAEMVLNCAKFTYSLFRYYLFSMIFI